MHYFREKVDFPWKPEHWMQSKTLYDAIQIPSISFTSLKFNFCHEKTKT